MTIAIKTNEGRVQTAFSHGDNLLAEVSAKIAESENSMLDLIRNSTTLSCQLKSSILSYANTVGSLAQTLDQLNAAKSFATAGGAIASGIASIGVSSAQKEATKDATTKVTELEKEQQAKVGDIAGAKAAALNPAGPSALVAGPATVAKSVEDLSKELEAIEKNINTEYTKISTIQSRYQSYGQMAQQICSASSEGLQGGFGLAQGANDKEKVTTEALMQMAQSNDSSVWANVQSGTEGFRSSVNLLQHVGEVMYRG